MTQFAAIPTVYSGVQFRSRLEARWAAFFDQTKQRWQYEPFDLPGWIPDFSWTPGEFEPTPLFEVKPISSGADITEVAAKILHAVNEAKTYDLWIIGQTPVAMWRYDGAGKWLPQKLDGWDAAWKLAGNAVQWKSPRLPR